jgi:hypothetical protein
VEWKEPTPLEREAAVASIASQDEETVCDALVRIAFHEQDWRWAQDQCLKLNGHPSARVRALVATCLGHIARIHEVLDLERVIPVLHELARDLQVRGQVQDALDDIHMFVDQTPNDAENPK